MSKLLEVQNLSKSFGGLAAVKDMSLCVEEGKIVSLIGPNGAGKTTVFNLLTGFYTYDTGSVVFKGQNVGNRKPNEYVKFGMIRTFQNVRLYSKLTVLENVLIGAQSKIHYSPLDIIFNTKKKKLAEKKAREEAMALLEDLGMEKYANITCENLPYGQQKKIEIVRAMSSSPQLLLFDEPAAGLNDQETAELSEFIQSLIPRGYTVLLIEHDMNLVMQISDYVYVMNYGHLLAEGKPEEIMGNQEVIEAYIGKRGVKNAAAN